MKAELKADKRDQINNLAEQLWKDPPSWAAQWADSLGEFLEWVDHADADTRASYDFQAKLWNNNPVTSTGSGSVDVTEVLKNETFRRFIADASLRTLPESPNERATHFRGLVDEIVSYFHHQRKPWLKIYRVLAALFPIDFTTFSYTERLHEFATRVLEEPPHHAVDQHIALRRAIHRSKSEPGHKGSEISAKRMILPWLIYDRLMARNDESTHEVIAGPGSERLNPLPVARRRKGLVAQKGYFHFMLNVLQEIERGVSRDEIFDYLRTVRPDFKDSSHSILINALQSEFGVIERHGEVYRLTPRGRAVLETSDPDPLADWLLTRILGFDYGLVHLREHEGLSNVEFQRAIQKANPGWTSLMAPAAIVGWMQALDLAVRRERRWYLTDRGRNWLELIHWTPGLLGIDAATSAEIDETDEDDDDDGGSSALIDASAPQPIALPRFPSIYSGFHLKFPDTLVAELHAGLWAHERRHFAVLAGLSGAGKTQLARQYAMALIGSKAAAESQFLSIAVHPGWYDPSPLLGYVNPLDPGVYVRPPFLEFLRHAVIRRNLPHVVLLDEMNLSRPEQYLAPLLSAMETGGTIELHHEKTLLSGIEPRLPYPNNLVIIGTINMDETTHGLSDKVLDRAHVLEFWDIEVAKHPRWDTNNLGEGTAMVKLVLESLTRALKPARLHFGWRVIDDVINFIEREQQHCATLSLADALDSVIYAKVLPKLRGEQTQRFQEALAKAREVATEHRLLRCEAKLTELEGDLRTTGSARFWR